MARLWGGPSASCPGIALAVNLTATPIPPFPNARRKDDGPGSFMECCMSSKSIGLGLIGAGRIGTFHAETMAKRLHDAKLVAIADPAPGAV